jgi:plastocyanin
MKRQGVLKTIALTAAAALAAVAVACAGGEATTPNATLPPEGPLAIEVLMKDNVFEPTAIRVRAGQTVTVTANNVGLAIHNMIVQTRDAEGRDFMSDTIVNPGEESVFEMTISTPGSYQFICAFHLPEMVGTVTVE